MKHFYHIIVTTELRLFFVRFLPSIHPISFTEQLHLLPPLPFSYSPYTFYYHSIGLYAYVQYKSAFKIMLVTIS